MKQLQILSLLIFILRITSSRLFPHIIWVYWNTGLQKLGNFQKLCYQRMKKLHEDTDWKINFVQQKTIPLFLNEQNLNKFNAAAAMSIKNNFFRQTKADLLRLYLLKEHGGVWLDISIILKENLNWLDNLLNNPKILHRNIFKNPEVFLNFQHRSDLNQKKVIKIESQNYYPLLQIQNAFIAAKSEARLINDLLNQFQSIINQGEQRYNKTKQSLSIPYQYKAYFACFRACSIIQYKKFSQYKNSLVSNIPIPNLKNHFYNFLTINRASAMLHGSLKQWRIVEYMLPQQGSLGDFQTESMKLPSYARKFLTNVLSNDQKTLQNWGRKLDYKTYQFGQKYLTQQYDFFYKLKVHEDSAVNKYFLYNKTLANQLFPKVEIVKNSQIPLICKIIALKNLLWIYPVVLQWMKLAMIIVIISQLVYQYLVFSFSSLFNSYRKNLSLLRYNIYTKFIYLTAFYLQKDLIYSQYQLWNQYSPTAVFVGIIQVILTLFIFTLFINIDSSKKKIYFWTILMILAWIQYYFIYNNSAWKYQGQIYSYENLAPLNKIKIYQGIVHLIKIGILITLFNMFTGLKWLFNLFSDESLQIQKNNMISDIIIREGTQIEMDNQLISEERLQQKYDQKNVPKQIITEEK